MRETILENTNVLSYEIIISFFGKEALEKPVNFLIYYFSTKSRSDISYKKFPQDTKAEVFKRAITSSIYMNKIYKEENFEDIKSINTAYPKSNLAIETVNVTGENIGKTYTYKFTTDLENIYATIICYYISNDMTMIASFKSNDTEERVIGIDIFKPSNYDFY